jgi:hypothetical protein
MQRWRIMHIISCIISYSFAWASNWWQFTTHRWVNLFPDDFERSVHHVWRVFKSTIMIGSTDVRNIRAFSVCGIGKIAKYRFFCVTTTSEQRLFSAEANSYSLHKSSDNKHRTPWVHHTKITPTTHHSISDKTIPTLPNLNLQVGLLTFEILSYRIDPASLPRFIRSINIFEQQIVNDDDDDDKSKNNSLLLDYHTAYSEFLFFHPLYQRNLFWPRKIHITINDNIYKWQI